MGGGYLNNNKKNYSERRNHGLSLTNLTHCISPSEYCNDYYNNNSFNEIKLQLHASSKVSNPYSFSIKSNTGFSGVVQSILPTTETVLLKIEGYFQGQKGTFIVPNGCKVVKAYIFNRFADMGDLMNINTNKLWLNMDTGVDSDTKYIGVTPGKQYTLTCYSEYDRAIATVSYSAEINTHTPDVEDY